MTVASIITEYLKEHLANSSSYMFANHIIGSKIPDYGKDKFNIQHNSETYGRAWRAMREDGIKGLIVREIDVTSKEKYFEVRDV